MPPPKVIQELLRPLPWGRPLSFPPKVKGEKDIWNSSIPKEIMGAVADFYRNVTLVKGKSGLYYPRSDYHGIPGATNPCAARNGATLITSWGKRAGRQIRTGKPRAVN
jgi:hypothetical protein